jgi:hypothetical protein
MAFSVLPASPEAMAIQNLNAAQQAQIEQLQDYAKAQMEEVQMLDLGTNGDGSNSIIATLNQGQKDVGGAEAAQLNDQATGSYLSAGVDAASAGAMFGSGALASAKSAPLQDDLSDTEAMQTDMQSKPTSDVVVAPQADDADMAELGGAHLAEKPAQSTAQVKQERLQKAAQIKANNPNVEARIQEFKRGDISNYNAKDETQLQTNKDAVEYLKLTNDADDANVASDQKSDYEKVSDKVDKRISAKNSAISSINAKQQEAIAIMRPLTDMLNALASAYSQGEQANDAVKKADATAAAGTLQSVVQQAQQNISAFEKNRQDAKDALSTESSVLGAMSRNASPV